MKRKEQTVSVDVNKADKTISVDMTMFLFGFEILEYLWNAKDYSYDERLNEINIKRILPRTTKEDILGAINNCLFLKTLPQDYKTAICRFVKSVFIDNDFKPVIDTEFSLKALEVKEFRQATERNKHMLQKALFNNYLTYKKAKTGIINRAVSGNAGGLLSSRPKKLRSYVL